MFFSGRVIDASGHGGVANTPLQLVALGYPPDRDTACPAVVAEATTDELGRFELESADFTRLSSCERGTVPFLFDHLAIGGRRPRTYDLDGVGSFTDMRIRTSQTRSMDIELRCDTPDEALIEEAAPAILVHWLPGRDLFSRSSLMATHDRATYRARVALPLGAVQLTAVGGCGVVTTRLDTRTLDDSHDHIALTAARRDAGSISVEFPSQVGREVVSSTLMLGPAVVGRLSPTSTRVTRLAQGTYTLAPSATESRRRCLRSIVVEPNRTTEVILGGCVVARTR